MEDSDHLANGEGDQHFLPCLPCDAVDREGYFQRVEMPF